MFEAENKKGLAVNKNRNNPWFRDVAVVGAGMSKFGSFPGKTSRDLFVDAFLDMKNHIEKGLNFDRIEAFYLGNFSSDRFEKQSHLAPILANWIGLSPIPAIRIEDACASGGVALRQAALAIASGEYDVILVGGVEKMTNLCISDATDVLGMAADTMFEVSAGFTFPGFYGAMATAYMGKYHTPREALFHVSIKNHQNGALNANAQFNKSIREIMRGKINKAIQKGEAAPEWKDEFDFLKDPKSNPNIAWPMALYDCSPISDGSAVVLLTAEDIAKEFTDIPLYLIGSGQASDGALSDRSSLTSIPAAVSAARKAYEMAGIRPGEIDFAEVHDCFTIAEIIAIEDLGFFPSGEGWKAAMDGRTSRNGDRPINTSGGLKAKGHPVGASGLGQVYEIWEQLHGKAGQRQLPNAPRIGLTHNVGGSGQTCVVNIFERRD